ncbi:MAG: RNA-binding domain-containing protein [Promethearchaeota archaeon]
MAATESGPIRLTVQASVQATENAEKVKKAIENLFPADLRSTLKFNKTNLQGHYHNPILRLETQLSQRDRIERTLASIGQSLSSGDRAQLARTFSSRIDEKGGLFIRFDKQEAYEGRIRIIHRGDSIRMVIRFSGRKPSVNQLEHHCRQFQLI